MKAGVAEIDISPPLGLTMAGSFRSRRIEGVRDPLFASALVLEDEEHRLALVGCDLLFLPRTVVESVRRAVRNEVGIPERDVALFCTHTHTGPLTCELHGRMPDDGYIETLIEKVVRSVSNAARRLEPAEVASASAMERGISFNRRFVMKDGFVRTHPVRGFLENAHAEGPIDPEVGVLCVRRPAGPVLGYVVNFACHANVVRGNEVSADFPGAVRRRMKAAHGPECVTLFANGASGDVCQIDVSNPEKEDSGFVWAEHMGEVLAGRVFEACEGMVFGTDPILRIQDRSLSVRLRDPGLTPYHGTMFGGPTIELVDQLYEAYGERFARLPDDPSETVEIQALRIGDAALVMIPGEPFAALGLELKLRSPFRPTLVVGLANGCSGYIPTEEAFQRGGYEVRTGEGSRLVPTAGKQIIEHALDDLSNLV